MTEATFWDVQGGKMGGKHKPACRRTVGRAFLIAGAVAGVMLVLGTLVSPLGAQTYPNKPVRLILPFPPGGATDVLGRVVGQSLAEALGQPVVPENRPGAGGNIGAEVVAKATPDGYALLFASPSVPIGQSLYKNLSFDPSKDLAGISMVMEGHYVMVIRPTLAVKSLQEFIAYAKANPGKVTYGGGIGTPPHMAGELFSSLTGIKMTHVPYKGVNDAMKGAMTGEIDMVVIGTPGALPQIQAGRVRALAVLTKQRLPVLPDVPTVGEGGVPQFVVTSWYGIMTTAGTPRAVINQLNRAWVKLASSPEVKERSQKVGFEPVTGTPEEFDKFIKDEMERWGKIVKDANIKVN